MSDLSRLLDDVYEPPAVKDDAKGWTSDEALDSAFSDWVPGPGEDASETEKSLFAGAKKRPTDESGSIADKNLGGLPTESLATPAPPIDPVLSDPPSDRIESSPVTTLLSAITVDDLAPADKVDESPRTGQEWASATASHDTIAPIPVAWRPEDDDILPARASHKFFGLSLHR
jgi:hypothetical protein